mmetsp:Transcript_397/g.589  ORF Transcript_397/g.589 Transcript_397/m.589 type:complete len:439 (-) Transcript_397:345-1661(-)
MSHVCLEHQIHLIIVRSIHSIHLNKPNMKVSALLLAQLLIASSAEARLFQRTRDTNRAREKDDDTDRIINGVEAEEDRYSYMVSLKDNQGHFCGASLIAKDIVLSAAHCAGGGYDAIIGRHKHNDNDGDKVRVSKEFIHPKYNGQTTNNDFMVLKLSRETKAGTPVKINSSRSTPQDNQNVVVMGFGVTNENTQQTSNKLMEVTVKVVSDSECRESYGNEITSSTMICAAASSKDSCQGDSGGPLILKGSSAATDIQVGIVSWGYGCADPSYPGVYAEVSAGYDFIQQIVCQESEDVNARDAFQCSGSAEAAIAPSGGGGSASQGDDDLDYDDLGSSFGGFAGSSGNPGSGGSGDDYIDDDWSDDYNYDDGNFYDDDDGGGGGWGDDYNYDDRWYDDDRYDDGNYANDDDWDGSSSGQSYGGGGWTGSMASWWSNLWH